MENRNARKHTTLFRAVSTFVFILLLITSVSNSYAEKDDLLTNVINQLNSLLFGSSQNSSSSSSSNGGETGDSTCVPGHDPSTDPPPPPPPPPPEN